MALAVTSFAYGLWDNDRSNDRDACMAQSFRQLGDSLTTRSQLATEGDELNAEIDRNQNELILSVVSADTREEFMKIFGVFKERDAELNEQQQNLLKEREETEIPAFPEGTCEE